MTCIESFYPKYPFIDKNPLDPYKESFSDAIVTKKEFASQKLAATEERPTNPGELLRHQTYIARFMAPTTGYNELLLFHEPGTGKTCSAVAVIEGLKGTFKGAIVCAKGEGLNKNFRQELVFTCTDGRYIPEGYDRLSDLQRVTRIQRMIGDFYTLRTFETLAKEIGSLSDRQLCDRYENHIFIIDEVHNLREKDELDEENELDENPLATKRINIYLQFHRLFHVLTRRKILLMSGTPIKDTPEEFASVMNLILPLDLQFDSQTFVHHYFTDKGKLRQETRDEMINKIRGRISYISSAPSNVKRVFIGSRFGNLKHFIVATDVMSDFQTDVYKKAYKDDKTTRSIYTGSRQASLFVFPDGSVGPSGFEKFIVSRQQGVYEATRELTDEIRTIKGLSRLSSKYGMVVDTITKSFPSKHFVFCQYVNGSGSIVFAKALEQFGYTAANGTEKTKRKRFALCTHQTTSNTIIRRIIDRFNNDDNIDGEFISVIIGSKVLNEGFTLKNVRNEFILTPHWNYAETAQAIARGWRFGSHDTLLARGDANVTVNVYQCVSLPNSSAIPSIDLELYETAENKDVINRQIERLVKENAFDCPLTIERNKVSGYDGERECDYQACDYKCAGNIGPVLDTSTYNLLEDIQKSVRDRVLNILNRELKTNLNYSLDKLLAAMPDTEEMEIVKAISSLLDSDVIFTDRFGFSKFIRISGRTLFLSSDPNTSNEVFTEYYSRNSILENGEQFDDILAEVYEDSLPNKVAQLFDYPELTTTLIVALPPRVQREVLYGCLMSLDQKKEKNVDIRDVILEFFTGVFSKQIFHGEETWIVNLYSETLGTTRYDRATNKFVVCDVEELPKIGINASPIGWYGLYNPRLQDFCIRDISQPTRGKTDLRKLTVGRRCVNYDIPVLVDIVSRRMMCDPPMSFKRAASRAELLADLSTTKNAIPSDFTSDDDSIRRVLYWSFVKKTDLCEMMKNWFKSHNLLETNFDCGTQKKSRAKFR